MSYDYKYILLVLVEIGFFTGFLYINTHCISGFLSLNTNTNRPVAVAVAIFTYITFFANGGLVP
jgi:hypothetical protein